MLLYLAKKAFLHDEKFWKEEGILFLFNVIFIKMYFIKFSLELSKELLQAILHFNLNFFFHLKLYHKNQFHSSYHVPSNICHKSVIILTFAY